MKDKFMSEIEYFIKITFDNEIRNEKFHFLQWHDGLLNIDVVKNDIQLDAEQLTNDIWSLARENPNKVLKYFKNWLYVEYPTKIHLFKGFTLSYYWNGDVSPKGKINM